MSDRARMFCWADEGWHGARAPVSGKTSVVAEPSTAARERDELRELAWAAIDEVGHPILLGTALDALYRRICELDYEHGAALAGGSGVKPNG